jgi:hypothetical protein
VVVVVVVTGQLILQRLQFDPNGIIIAEQR